MNKILERARGKSLQPADRRAQHRPAELFRQRGGQTLGGIGMAKLLQAVCESLQRGNLKQPTPNPSQESGACPVVPLLGGVRGASAGYQRHHEFADVLRFKPILTAM